MRDAKRNTDPVERASAISKIRYNSFDMGPFAATLSGGEDRHVVYTDLSISAYNAICDDASFDKIEKEVLSRLCEFMMFDTVFSMSRNQYGPTCGRGSQDDSYELNESIAAITMKLVQKKHKEYNR
jgi:hypothetical protein